MSLQQRFFAGAFDRLEEGGKNCFKIRMNSASANPANPKAESAASTPLDSLSVMFEPQMRAVNARILEAMRSDVPLIPRLAGYLIAAGGKRIRPLLTLACAGLYDRQGPAAQSLACAVEFIHTATLLHDDVVDGSEERRGQAPANLIFGNQASVLVGDFLFSRAFQLMVDQGSLEVLRILSQASAVIAEGEVMQLAAANDLKTTMDRYLQVISAKTAALFSAACEIGPVLGNAGDQAQEALRDYGHHLGIAFQIADDVLDYGMGVESFGKAPGNDFQEGKLTAPLLIALQDASSEEAAFWKRTIQDRASGPSDLAQARKIIAGHDGFSKALALARAHADRAASALSVAPEGSVRDALTELAVFAVERQF